MSQISKKIPLNCKNDASVSHAPFSLCISTERPSFDEAFASVARLLEGRKNILVLAGAGMSVSCGIPDFRSKDGLYSGLDVASLGLSCPEDLFDFEFFKEDPAPFYQFARRLYFPKGTDTKVEPSDSHRFLAYLEQQNRLLRVYTQNIDGLEHQAGVSEKHIVYAHGSLQWATCLKCKHKLNATEIEESILKGVVPRCQQPVVYKEKSKNGLGGDESTPRSSKRHRPAEKNSTIATNRSLCGGVLKPGVVFFGEPLNGNVKRTFESDRDKADALIVIGTSLSVAPMSHVLEFVPKHLPRILINRNIVHPPIRQHVKDDHDDDKPQQDHDDDETTDFREGYMFDVYMLGFCDDVTRALVKEMTGSNDPRGKEGGRLLACLKDEDSRYELQDWESTRLPKDRVFLFPGAQSGDSLVEYSYREVAHCDGCSNQIEGTIRKCTQCFDYDLCEACFPQLSLTHHGGQHTFSSEAAG